MIEMNEEQFRLAVADSRPILVDFWAPWCVHCRRLAPALESLDGLTIPIAKINIDEEPELAKKEKIDVIPTLKIYREGKTLGSIVGPDSKAKIEEFIRSTLGE